MKRLIVLAIVVVLCAGFGFLSYRYLVIRDGARFHFMEKSPGTFDRVYVDVTDWTPRDYLMHPGIAAFLAGEKIRKKGAVAKDKVSDGIEKTKDAIKEGLDKTEDAVKDGVDQLKEKLDDSSGE